jgi:hypothetical protein
MGLEVRGQRAEVACQFRFGKPTVAGRFHGRAFLQCRVVDCLPVVLSAVVIRKEEAHRAKERLPKLIGFCGSTRVAIPNSGLDLFTSPFTPS